MRTWRAPSAIGVVWMAIGIAGIYQRILVYPIPTLTSAFCGHRFANACTQTEAYKPWP